MCIHLSSEWYDYILLSTTTLQLLRPQNSIYTIINLHSLENPKQALASKLNWEHQQRLDVSTVVSCWLINLNGQPFQKDGGDVCIGSRSTNAITSVCDVVQNIESFEIPTLQDKWTWDFIVFSFREQQLPANKSRLHAKVCGQVKGKISSQSTRVIHVLAKMWVDAEFWCIFVLLNMNFSFSCAKASRYISPILKLLQQARGLANLIYGYRWISFSVIKFTHCTSLSGFEATIVDASSRLLKSRDVLDLQKF